MGRKTGSHAASHPSPPSDGPAQPATFGRSFIGAPPRYNTASAAISTFSNLTTVLSRDDGWLRIVPTSDGKLLYIKWKFTDGPWKGHYVMARVEFWQIEYGLELLVDKLTAVDVDGRRPTLDTAYDA